MRTIDLEDCLGMNDVTTQEGEVCTGVVHVQCASIFLIYSNNFRKKCCVLSPIYNSAFFVNYFSLYIGLYTIYIWSYNVFKTSYTHQYLSNYIYIYIYIYISDYTMFPQLPASINCFLIMQITFHNFLHPLIFLQFIKRLHNFLHPLTFVQFIKVFITSCTH